MTDPPSRPTIDACLPTRTPPAAPSATRRSPLLAEAIRSGTLTSTKGNFVNTLEQRFAELLGVKHCHACASGTAAIHSAVAALDPEPGDEFVTTLDHRHGCPDADPLPGRHPRLRRRRSANLQRHGRDHRAGPISDRTRAIIVTHLFGNPCDMGDDHGAGPVSTTSR